mgnify:CR=1 FL=1
MAAASWASAAVTAAPVATGDSWSALRGKLGWGLSLRLRLLVLLLLVPRLAASLDRAAAAVAKPAQETSAVIVAYSAPAEVYTCTGGAGTTLPVLLLSAGLEGGGGKKS